MKQILNKRAAFVLWTVLSVVMVATAIASYRNYSMFSTFLWIISIPLIAMAVCSIALSDRFPTFFNGSSVLWGFIYGLITSAGCIAVFCAALLYGLGLSDNHPVRSMFFISATLLLLVLFFVAIMIDAVINKPNFREGLSRVLIGMISYFPFGCILLAVGEILGL